MNTFVDIDYCQKAKRGQFISGDVFLSENVREEDRIVSVLSDGLGSGVKASVLATMTATMALKFAVSSMNIRESAEIIMDTLPICSVRQISYSTFTVVDVAPHGEARIMEHGNPPFILIRAQSRADMDCTEVHLNRWQDRIIHFSRFMIQPEDRIVFYSDGITQAGMGSPLTPLGWGAGAVEAYARALIADEATISSRDLSRRIVAQAVAMDGDSAQDDITCSVIYFRRPRELLILTGAPFQFAHDRDFAQLARSARGRKVICGGTTANILARQLGREIRVDLYQPLDHKIPPAARMEGFDLVTEGTLTLGEVLHIFEEGYDPEEMTPNPAVRLVRMLLDSDLVHFAVGTRINEAHQDPNIPIELGLRRNLVKRIAHILEKKHLKTTSIQYF